MDITQIDKNFVVGIADNDGCVYHNVLEKPFKIYGLMHDENGFCRMPQSVADSVSEGVSGLNRHSAGGRVRFVTDAGQICIRAKLGRISRFSHMPISGSAGFDLYNEYEYVKSFIPVPDVQKGNVVNEGGYIHHGTVKKHLYTLNFPLYSEVCELEIGLPEGCILEEAPDYDDENYIVYYGSSITQGGCASRPGNCYQAIIERVLHCDYLNLGFSGNAKAEKEIYDYINGIDKMTCFVYDYDHNAPTTEYLKATHYPMYEAVRKAHPDLPIIMMTRPQTFMTEAEYDRRIVVMESYIKAWQSGDKNVYFIDGSAMLDNIPDGGGNVDNCHPTDTGFVGMANSLLPILKRIIK